MTSDFFATHVPPPPLCPCCDANSIWATRVGLDGVIDPSWPAYGDYAGAIGEVLPDGSGGLLSVGASFYPCASAARGVAMRLGPDRSRPWDPGTTPICDQPQNQRAPSIAPDGSGGAYIGWVDLRDNGVPVLYATRLDAAGDFAAGWPASGSMEALGAIAPSEPHVVATQPGTAIVVWVDRRNGNADIWAREMVPGPAGPPASGVDETAIAFGFSRVVPNPSHSGARVTLDLPPGSPGSFEVVDLAGRVCEQRSLSVGRNTVTINAAARMQPGVYWLRVRQDGNVAVRRFVLAR